MAKKTPLYGWESDAAPPPLHKHSKTKHDVYRQYLSDYLRERLKNVRIDKFRINVIDGFCGGGIFSTGRTGVYEDGSPLIILETLEKLKTEIQATRRKPFELDYHLYFVDKDPEAIALLKTTLKQRGYEHLIGNRIEIQCEEFVSAAPSLIGKLKGRGSSIFILDQYGYSDVPFNILRSIFTELHKPEVILTFAYGHLETFVRDYERLNKHLKSLGLSEIQRDKFEEVERSRWMLNYFIQQQLHVAFLGVAPYFTPFFIVSRDDSAAGLGGSNLAYWLVHLSKHSLANDVMKRTHWALNNHFAHFGGDGMFMLGFDPNNAPNGDQAYLFQDTDKQKTLASLQDQLPRFLADYDQGLLAGQLWDLTCNTTPSTSEIQRTALSELASAGEIQILTHSGGKKRNLQIIRPSDRLILPKQFSWKM